MHKIEYDVEDMIKEIKQLTYKDYLRCQIDSKYDYLFMFCFLKKIKNFLVFIKLSIIEKSDKIACVISFHEAEKDELYKRPFEEV